jgi:aryl carrier-like protein
MHHRQVLSQPTSFDVETVVVNILESLLHSPVSLQDTLLSQGLDSLGMSQFLLELQERFRKLDIKSIHIGTGANQTIHQIIKNIHEATQAEVDEETLGTSNRRSANDLSMRTRIEHVRMFLVSNTTSTAHHFLKLIFWLLIVFTGLTSFTRFTFAELTGWNPARAKT